MKTAKKEKKAPKKGTKTKTKVKAPVKALKAKGDVKKDADTPTEVRLKPDHSKYGHAAKADGKKAYDNGDPTATFLRSCSLERSYALVVAFGMPDQHDKYEHLNKGMQRMNLGNKLRGVLQREKFESFEDAITAHEINLQKLPA
ncbi:hypothetical protein KAR91_03905 [Candidatus Pacearchaeota archaeon]|nr:hypothetical protein [Candidatus Pacearchaeota archaeon]